MGDEEAAALTRYLHESIPLTAAMEIAAVAADPERVCLAAPLGPNRNHQGGVFGGSIATLGLAACWALARTRVRDRAPEPVLMVGEQRVRYLRPAEHAIEATCEAPAADTWAQFRDALDRRGRARVELEAAVVSGGVTVARFHGRFHALART